MYHVWKDNTGKEGFNRYMVECESVKWTDNDTNEVSFNRYMVECEYDRI